eukprot:jgi/Mesvir1/27837/Mv07514-RA.1
MHKNTHGLPNYWVELRVLVNNNRCSRQTCKEFPGKEAALDIDFQIVQRDGGHCETYALSRAPTMWLFAGGALTNTGTGSNLAVVSGTQVDVSTGEIEWTSSSTAFSSGTDRVTIDLSEATTGDSHDLLPGL